MTHPAAPAKILWSRIDPDGDACLLEAGPALDGDPRPLGAVAHFEFGPGPVDLDLAAVRRLRDACDRLLAGDDDRLSDAALEAVGRRSVVKIDAISRMLAQLVDAQRTLDGDGDPIMSGLLSAVSDLTRQVGHLASAVGRVP